jgi:hypothetical protein
MTDTGQAAELLTRFVGLVEELCDAVDSEGHDIGGHRGSLTILREIGPLIEGTREAIAAWNNRAHSPAPKGLLTREEIEGLRLRLKHVAEHDWRVSFLAHTSDTAAEAERTIDLLFTALVDRAHPPAEEVVERLLGPFQVSYKPDQIGMWPARQALRDEILAALAAAQPAPDSGVFAEMVGVLKALVEVIDSAGLHHLCDGVQLGKSSWYVKAVDRMSAAREVLAKAETAAARIESVPEGWQAVPKEPTEEMFEALGRSMESGFNERQEVDLKVGDPALEELLWGNLPDDAPMHITVRLGVQRRARAVLGSPADHQTGEAEDAKAGGPTCTGPLCNGEQIYRRGKADGIAAERERAAGIAEEWEVSIFQSQFGSKEHCEEIELVANSVGPSIATAIRTPSPEGGES